MRSGSRLAPGACRVPLSHVGRPVIFPLAPGPHVPLSAGEYVTRKTQSSLFPPLLPNQLPPSSFSSHYRLTLYTIVHRLFGLRLITGDLTLYLMRGVIRLLYHKLGRQ